MAAARKPQPEPSEIGQRVRAIRRRRGLSLDVVAGLAGISKPYLSQLETGHRRFERRSLVENLANALGCAVADLTGQPYLPGDRAGADALATLPEISVALYDATLTDAPDIPARDIHELVRLAATANEHTANNRYDQAGHNLGTILTELHVHAATGDTDTRRHALAALAEACFVASGTARMLGNHDLAVHAARRGEETARQLDDPALRAFASMTSISALSRLGARHRATTVATSALTMVYDAVDPTGPDTSAAEAAGMLHLSAAQLAAKDHRANDVDTHLAAARDLAEHTGERNRLWFSFGPANIRAWSLSIAIELDRGPATAETMERTPGYADGLTTADRRSSLHFDMARAYAQAGGDRDTAALRHLDTADRISPLRVRPDPIARELIANLGHRARTTTWELDSFRNRFGLTKARG